VTHFHLVLHDEVVGELDVATSAAGPRWSGWWRDDWLNAVDRPVVSLRLHDLRPTGKRDWGSRPPPFITNLLPEHGGALRRRLARTHGIDETDDAAMLTLLGDDMSGAIRVLPAAAAAGPTTVRPSSEPRPLAAYRASLGGMQLKFSANRHDRVTLPARGETGLWILKIPAPDQPTLPRLEAAALAWAAAVGFDVPETDLVDSSRVDGLPDDVLRQVPECLLVRRFDRADDGRRVHLEELCSVMGFHPEEKYPGDAGQGRRPTTHTFAGLCGVIRRQAGSSDAALFIRRLLFDALVGNGDAHLKNWAFIFPDSRTPRLAPAYDIVPTALLQGDTTLALPVTGHELLGVNRFVDVTPDRVRSLARKVQLDPIEVVDDCARLVRRAVDTFDVTTRPFQLTSSLHDAWAFHVRSVASPWLA
jgi:serine/threonine-protein kinase HipA